MIGHQCIRMHRYRKLRGCSAQPIEVDGVISRCMKQDLTIVSTNQDMHGLTRNNNTCLASHYAGLPS